MPGSKICYIYLNQPVIIATVVSMFSNRWLVFQKVYDQVRAISETVSQSQADKIGQLLQRFQRIAELKKNLDEEDYILKQQYIKLTREKALYSSKLQDITSIGNNLQWEQRSRLLQKVGPLLAYAKEKLRQDNKNAMGDNQHKQARN